MAEILIWYGIIVFCCPFTNTNYANTTTSIFITTTTYYYYYYYFHHHHYHHYHPNNINTPECNQTRQCVRVGVNGERTSMHARTDGNMVVCLHYLGDAVPRQGSGSQVCARQRGRRGGGSDLQGDTRVWWVARNRQARRCYFQDNLEAGWVASACEA